MSAFVVAHDHIDAVVTYAVDHGASYWNPELKRRVNITAQNATETGRILLAENERSVAFRYRDPVKPDMKASDAYAFRRWGAPLHPLSILKALDCLDYQSSETDDWEMTLAHRIIGELRGWAIRRLPGWDDADGWCMQRNRTRVSLRMAT